MYINFDELHNYVYYMFSAVKDVLSSKTLFSIATDAAPSTCVL